MSSNNFDELVAPFAEAIWALARERDGDVVALNAFQKARVREAVSTLIRKACDVVYPEVRAPEVSTAAHTAATELGVDLRLQSWHSQNAFDPGRKVFHYEHMQPVSVLVRRCSLALSADEVLHILHSGLRLAWITKTEDQRLNSLGFASKRPDPDAAYAAAGIGLVPDTASPQSGINFDGPSFDEAPPPDAPTSNSPDVAADASLLPPIVTSRESSVDGGPHETGFMPVAQPGSTDRL